MATTTIFTTPTPTSNNAGPSQGHLGTSWEIAVAVIIIVLACIVIGTVVWQIRRRRQRQRRLLLTSAAEEGRRGSLTQSQMGHLPSDGIRLATEIEVDKVLTKPRSTASPYHPRTSSTSSTRNDHRPIQPQRYYWNP